MASINKVWRRSTRKNEHGNFKSLIKFGTCLDVSSALVGTCISVISIHYYGAWQEWDPDTIKLGMLYSAVIAFNLSGTPTAVLRLFNKFKLITYQKVIAALIKLIGTAIAYMVNGDITFVLVVWMFSEIIGYIILLIMGWGELGKNGYKEVLKNKVGVASKIYPNIWGFVLTTNINESIRMTSREVDTMIVGGMLGAYAAGLYKIAKQFSGTLSRLADPLYQAVFPELSRLWANRKTNEFTKMVLRSSALAGVGAIIVWLGFILLGEIFLNITVGSEYLDAYDVLILYMLAIVISVIGFSLVPAMLAIGRPHITFWIHIVSTVLYFPVLVYLISLYGLIGAGIAYVIYYVVWTILMVLILYRELSNAKHEIISS